MPSFLLWLMLYLVQCNYHFALSSLFLSTELLALSSVQDLKEHGQWLYLFRLKLLANIRHFKIGFSTRIKRHVFSQGCRKMKVQISKLARLSQRMGAKDLQMAIVKHFGRARRREIHALARIQCKNRRNFEIKYFVSSMNRSPLQELLLDVSDVIEMPNIICPMYVRFWQNR